MTRTIELPDWMDGVDPSQIGFPFELDRSLYRKRTGIVYKKTESGPLELDAYWPAEGGPFPVVVMIHGGGWATGGRFQMGLTKWAGYLASGGLVVFSIDYRLAPRARYPEPFVDCLDAMDWTVEHASEFQGDPERLGLWGDSAGGHLALLVALTQTRPDFEGPRMRSESWRLRAVAALYPPTDLLRLHRSEERARRETTVVRNFLGVDPENAPELWREASPIEQIHPAAPPILVLQGTRDLLVPHRHTEEFVARLRSAGVPCEFHLLEGGLHGFDRVAAGPEAQRLVERTRDFLLEKLTAPSRETGDSRAGS
ncbi:MAG: hypothetical protein KatS3mg076_1973 [Candidatus Binatia bacterium]|nr:MAG: hypothetical protein KatS3mg076_1973 [Candidatus Binatia bacterium]